MTNIGTANYSDFIRQAISRNKTKSSPETDAAAESGAENSFGAMFLGLNVKSEIININVNISENESGIPSKWTSSSLYNIDLETLEGYRVNFDAISKVKEQLRAEGIDASRRTPTHEITDEQLEWLSTRHDLDFVCACSFEHVDFGNFMLDLAYLNVFSLDEVKNMYGVLPFNANHKGYLYKIDTGDGLSGYVNPSGGIDNYIDDEDEMYTQLIMEYLKAKYTGHTDKDYERMTKDYAAQIKERREVRKDIFARIAEYATDRTDNSARPTIVSASDKLKEDFGVFI